MEQRFPEKLIQPVKNLLSNQKKIVITTHSRPDGDAIGSSLGLYNYLLQKNQQVQVITPTDYPSFLKWMPGNEFVLNYENNIAQAEEIISEADVIFCLDFNRLNRIEKMQEAVKASKAVKILIDHHPDPENTFDHTFSYVTSCATAELIYQLIIALSDRAMINKQVAECLYAGIMTDTNSFRFESMKADTHRIVAALMEAGAVNFKIHELIYDTNTEERLRLLGMSLKDKLTVLPEFRSGYIFLTKAELEKYNYQPGDTEGLVNYILSINGIKLAAFFSETLFENTDKSKNIIKISFRSRDGFYCNELAEKYFNGGGHKYAAGGRSELPLDQTLKKFLGILPEYKEKLTQ